MWNEFEQPNADPSGWDTWMCGINLSGTDLDTGASGSGTKYRVNG